MIGIIYTSTADLYRLKQETANTDREKYERIFQGFKINIQPAGLEYVVTQPDGALGKQYRGFTTYSGCQIGMRMVVSGTPTISGMAYDIIGVEPYQMGPMGKTFELLVRKITN